MPSSLIVNSIHIFDLIYYLCDGLDSQYSEKLTQIHIFFIKTNNVEEVILI